MSIGILTQLSRLLGMPANLRTLTIERSFAFVLSATHVENAPILVVPCHSLRISVSLRR